MITFDSSLNDADNSDLTSFSGEPQKIRLGAHDLRNIGNDDDHTIDYNIAERIRHPEYRASSQYNDIALIKMDRAVPLTPYVRPACLPTMAAVPTTRAIATGWGHLQWKGSPSDVLLKVTLDMFTHSECNQTYEFHINRRLRHGIVDETQVCAGSHEGEKDTCQVNIKKIYVFINNEQKLQNLILVNLVSALSLVYTKI